MSDSIEDPAATQAPRALVAHARQRALRRIAAHPGREDRTWLWGLLDCAADDRLFDWLQAEPAHPVPPLCLYDGHAAIRYARYAPYLVPLRTSGSPLVERWLSDGWNSHWGIFLAARQMPTVLKRHFKGLHGCIDKRGRQMLVRYYDPRVLPVLLSSANTDTCRRYFGGSTIQAFLVPQDRHVWRGTLDSGALGRSLGMGRLGEREFDWMAEAGASVLQLAA